MSGDGNVDVHLGAALSRLDCPTCGPASLYRGRACIHCGQQLRVASVAPVGRKKRDWTVRRKAAPRLAKHAV